MSDPLDLLKNPADTKTCPINWSEMRGSDIVRTCTKCGALVLNSETPDTEKLRELIRKYGDPKVKRLYRRPTDGKLMLRPCGPNYELTGHCLGWTGGGGLALIMGNWLFGFDRNHIFPSSLLVVALFAWNLLGALLLAHNMRRPNLLRLIMFMSMTPLAVLEILTFASLVIHVYWDIMFPLGSPNHLNH